MTVSTINDITDVFDELEVMCNLLNACKSLGSISDFNRQIRLLDIGDSNISTFLNILMAASLTSIALKFLKLSTLHSGHQSV